VDPLRWLAHTCAQLGAQEEGVRAVKESLERIGYPGNGYWGRPLAPKVLGTALMVLHRFQEYGLLAEVAAEHLRRFPRNPEAVMAGGVALAELGRFEEAEPLLREALLHPANAADAEEIAFSLGVALAKQAKWSEAAGVLTTLLAKDPYFAKAYHQLGLVFSRLGRPREAEAMHATSRELAPSEREMRREIEMRGAGEPGRAAAARALALTLRGEPGEAERTLRAGDLRDDPYAVFALADFYIEALRASDAERVLAQGEKLTGPGHDDVLGRRALVLELRGERERAFAILRSLTSREGAASFWKTTFARLLIEERRLDEAVKILEPAAKTGIDQAAAHFLGRALLEKGEAARALQVLRAVSPGDTRWRSWDAGAWLARAYLETDSNADEADGLLREAAPSSRSARAHLLARAMLAERRAATGDAAAAGEAREARAALERSDSIEPSVAALRRRIAAAAWPGSGPLYLSLARLVASRGDTRGAVRLGRLALAAEPRSAEVLRSLEGWLREDGDVFFRLRALRDLLEVSPGDEAAREAIREIESRWLAPAGTSP
ncbi:MAG TPA: hypothetical protein VMT52_14320, partial [Planctomycetota bacterium]|nr:hypothetical protein [Planctomycetota bacterium]